jgi:TatD DNase family protein
MIIDFHTHRVRETEPLIEVISLHGDQDRPYQFCTRGYHPWWTDQMLNNEQLDFLVRSYRDDDHCLGIGECGLDNLKGAPLDIQEKILIQHIEIANNLGAPMIIHCVRAYDRMIRLHKQYARTPWVVHGYARHAILAQQIIDEGIYLSLAPHDRMAPTYIETLRSVPMDRIFLETDSDASHNISERYQIFATLREMDITDLIEEIQTNFSNFFNQKWQHLNG